MKSNKYRVIERYIGSNPKIYQVFSVISLILAAISLLDNIFKFINISNSGTTTALILMSVILNERQMISKLANRMYKDGIIGSNQQKSAQQSDASEPASPAD